MGFHEVQFPPTISYDGSDGGPGFNTSIIVTDSGNEERVARWASARRKFNVAKGIQTQAQLSAVIGFYLARQGPAYGFRFKDWSDYHTGGDGSYTTDGGDAFSDMPLGVGDGTTTQFQLTKSYTSGPTTLLRNITKPVSGAVVVGGNGSNLTSGWTIDTTSGIVTFSTAPTSGEVLTWGGEFDIPARFGDDMDDHLPVKFQDFNAGGATITIQELMGTEVQDDEFFYGGAFELSTGSDFSLSVLQGRLNVIKATANIHAILPDLTNLAPGGPYFQLVNDATSTGTITLKTFLGSTGISISAGNAIEIDLSVDGSGNKIWYAF